MSISDATTTEEVIDLQRKAAELESRVAILRARKAAKGIQIDKFRSFVDSNIVAIHRADIHGNFIEVNHATERMLQYTAEEFLSGKVKWTDLTPPEYNEVNRQAIEQVVTTGFAPFFEKEYIRRDGTRIPVAVHLTALQKGGKDSLAVVLDLTEKKKIEAELQASEQKFRLLAEAIPQIVWITTPSGKLKYANQKFYDYTGVALAEGDGFAWLDIIHPEEKEECITRAQRCESLNQPFTMEMRYRAKNGTYRWHLVRAIFTVDARTGKRIWFGTSTDIDDQIRIAEDLKESEARFKTLADAIPQIVFTADAEGEINFFNHRWFEYTGLTVEQSQNNGWQLLIHPEDLPVYLKEWTNALASGDSYEVEFRLRRAVGLRSGLDYRWHLARAVAMRDKNGEVTKWFATWTEIEGQQKHRI